jgi:hypothetical protein
MLLGVFLAAELNPFYLKVRFRRFVDGQMLKVVFRLVLLALSVRKLAEPAVD